MEEKKSFFDGGPKMIFVFGIVTGVAVTSLLGGSFSLPEFGSGGSEGVVRTFDAADTNDDPVEPEDEIGSVKTLAPVTADEHIRGDIENAKVVLVEYSDFECPFCSRHHPTMEDIMTEFGDDVAWVYRHFPLSFHAEAEPSAIASECAAEQGAFWEYADELFDNQDELGDEYYLELAGDLALDVSAFTECYETEATADAVNEDRVSGAASGANGTPATFINGTLVSGAVPYDTLAQIVEEALAQ